MTYRTVFSCVPARIKKLIILINYCPIISYASDPFVSQIHMKILLKID